MNRLIIFIMIFLCIACSKKHPKENVLVLNLAEALRNQSDKIKLSEIADSISYIKLELTEQSMLKDFAPMMVQITDSFIFMINENRLFKFDRNGHFLKVRHYHGKGPKEFLQVSWFCYEPSLKRLYLSDYFLKKIGIFDTDLNYISTLENLQEYAYDMLSMNSNYIIYGLSWDDFIEERSKYSVSILDVNEGVILNRLKARTPRVEAPHTSMFFKGTDLFTYEGKVFYREHRSTDVYQLLSIDRDSLVYHVDIGEPCPASYDSDWLQKDKMYDYVRLDRMLENSKCIFISFDDKDKLRRIAVYDKSKHKLRVAPYEEKDIFLNGIENDLDGGMAWNTCYMTDENQLYTLIYPLSLLEKDFINRVKKNNKVSPLQKQKLLTLIENTDINDNSIVMLIHLK